MTKGKRAYKRREVEEKGPATAQSAPPVHDIRTYMLELTGGGKRKVTVPADWKVTFGPLLPGGKGGRSSCLALRFYEAGEKQRAIFTDVKNFRDMSIPVMDRVTKTKRQAIQKQTSKGMRDVMVEARISEWRDPEDDHEEDDDDFMSLEDMTT